MRASILAVLAIAGLVLGPALAQDVPTPTPRPKVTAPAGGVLPTATEPATTNSTATAPAATKPAATQPVATKPEATTPVAAKPAARPDAEVRGNVIMLRGLMNVFSLGMDTLARKLRAKDIPVRVINYTRWRDIAPGLVEDYKTDRSVVPMVIIGHSLGADGAVNMGNYLAENGVPVRLVVAFDGVHEGHTVSRGVQEVINYYKPDGWGKFVEAGPGFKGKLQNVDLSDRTEIDHLNIEKSTALHDEVIAKVTAIFGAAGN